MFTSQVVTKKMPRLIALNGRLHSGKDTAVSFIQAAAGPATVQRIAFADKLKASAANALGYRGDDYVAFCNWLKEEAKIHVSAESGWSKTLTGREFLQWYGTEAHRQVFDDQFWVDALLPKPRHDVPEYDAEGTPREQVQLRHRFPDADVLVVTDCRFPNEAKRVLDLGGEVWYINAEERLGPLPENAHVSEHPLPPEYITVTVDNNGTLEEFKGQIGCAWQTMSLT